MASEPSASPGETGAWPAFSLHERRVLGVLVEKAKTTPDAYPLTLNALITGSNQKSNRDPILNLSDVDVEDALSSLKRRCLVFEITGQGRVAKWRHGLYEAFRVDKVELAILGELLLRGPQTEGELRTRASRMEPIADLEALRGVLRPLMERRLVVYLSPEGRRGTVLTHGFHAPEELEHLRARHGGDAATSAVPSPAPSLPSPGRPPAQAEPQSAAVRSSDRSLAELAAARAEIAALQTSVAALQATVATLVEQLRDIKEALGM